jgi:hypothetical protein
MSAPPGTAAPGASTPTTRYGSPPTTNVRPSTAASPPSSRCQKPWSSTATMPRPGRVSSGRKPRPSATGRPSSANRPSLTLAPRTSRGSPTPSSVNTPGAYASTRSNVRLSSRMLMKSGADSEYWAPSGYTVRTSYSRSAAR